jgi:multidrug efflux pump subunit AcrA (membrane-fusion protein)
LGDDVNPLLKNDVTRAQYAVDKLKQTIAESQIAAPFSGKLLSISLIPGQEVQGYKAVVSLADVSQLEVSADLFSDQLNELAESMPVSLTLSSAPGKPLSGQVRLMPYPYGSGGKSTDETQTTDKSVRISINQTAQEAGYELGDLVRVTVEIERKDNALWLPPQAIRNFNGRRFAVLQDNDVQRRVDVKVGIEAEDRVEIEEGLEEGQTIVGP